MRLPPPCNTRKIGRSYVSRNLIHICHIRYGGYNISYIVRSHSHFGKPIRYSGKMASLLISIRRGTSKYYKNKTKKQHIASLLRRNVWGRMEIPKCAIFRHPRKFAPFKFKPYKRRRIHHEGRKIRNYSNIPHVVHRGIRSTSMTTKSHWRRGPALGKRMLSK